MLSSIFREEILKWNIETLQNYCFAEHSRKSPEVSSIDQKQTSGKFDTSNSTSEIFRCDNIKYNNDVIECF